MADVPRTVRPANSVRGDVAVPGDKSIAHRALIFAGLAPVPVTLRGLPDSDPIRCTRAAMATLGAWFTDRGDGKLRAEGVGGPGISEADQVVDCGSSGTAMRLLAGVAATRPHLTVLTGNASLRRRPMDRVLAPLRMMGATALGRDGDRLPPLVVRGGALCGFRHESAVASAQVKSAVLLAGLAAAGRVEIREPHPSRDHTERMLRWWGVELLCEPGCVVMEGGQPLIPPAAEPQVQIPGDLSSAAFLLAAAAVLPGSDVTVRGVGLNPTRAGVIEVLREMGAEVQLTDRGEWGLEPVCDVRLRCEGRPRPFDLAGERLVRALDEVPALAAAAALADGVSTIRDAAELRVKESDRLRVLANVLGALGAEVDERPDGLAIRGVPRLAGGVEIDPADDHRIAMAAAVATLGAREPVHIRQPGVVADSWPGFWAALDAVACRGDEP